MRFRLVMCTLAVTLVASFLLTVKATYSTKRHGPTVQITATVTDNSGGTLYYRWRSTDGTIQNVNSNTTSWTLPAGPGIHFAYVLVSNGLGGYTERRILVNTDTIGTNPENEDDFAHFSAPPAPAQVGDYLRVFETNYEDLQSTDARHEVYMPNILAFAENTTSSTRYPAAGNVVSSIRGEITIPGLPPGNYNLNCSQDGGVTFSSCGGNIMFPAATSGYVTNSCCSANPVVGRLALQDGGPCGTVNEFFGIHVTGTATLLDASNNILSGPVAINEFGDFELPTNASAASVLLTCEQSQVSVPVVLAGAGQTDLGQAVVTGVSAPVVQNMTATLKGQPLVPPVAKFLPPPSGFPSDILARSDGYLAAKGLDTRLGACMYYKAVGAVTGCDSQGNLFGAITFRDWRHKVKIGQFASYGVPTYTASYINKVDLNLARVQESVTYGSNQTAGVVCNHLGPPADTPDELVNPAQADIDTAVDNAVNNKNLVACVAMDYTVSKKVNNNLPFIRFLIFGPSGQLLPSVNLDGRREKFVPGTCVVCHGGDHYAGKFPEDGSGFANVGGHFLPYDAGNFEFSSKSGLTKADQQLALYNLNQNVLKAGPTQAAIDLITGWYQSSPPNNPVLDENYTPPSWTAAITTRLISAISRSSNTVTVDTTTSDVNLTTGQAITIAGVADPSFNGQFVVSVNSPTEFTYAQAGSSTPSSGGTATFDPTPFYRAVLARSCRTCHVNQIEPYNFDHYGNLAPPFAQTQVFSDVGFDMESNVCGGSAQFQRDHMMPNSLITFNRFWLSSGTAADQPALLSQFYGQDSGNSGCPPPQGALP